MDWFQELTEKGKMNFIFIGGAGSGKSEISLNFAARLAAITDKPIHFFDLDMTKPLFRSRDLCAEVERLGVVFHFEAQFFDAPTIVGGVNRLLREDDCYVILDVGGDDIGARSIGSYASLLNNEKTEVYYVVNGFRPWTLDIEEIDRTLGAILGVSHINLAKLKLVNNPNLGRTTRAEEVREEYDRVNEMLLPYLPLAFSCVREDVAAEVMREGENWFPLHLYLIYPWNQ